MQLYWNDIVKLKLSVNILNKILLGWLWPLLKTSAFATPYSIVDEFKKLV